MIKKLLCSFVLVALSSSSYALDPSELQKILGLNIKDLRSASGDFVQVKKLLGESKQMDTGDAANYEGRVSTGTWPRHPNRTNWGGLA